MLKLIGSSLDQWETGRKFQVLPCPDGRKINFVDFAHPGDEVSLTVSPLQDGDIVVAEIPNILLQSSEDLMVYARIDSETIYRTKRSVYKREKPADYVYTETEMLTYKALDERIEKLEQSAISDEQLEEAIAAYLEEHPIDAGLDKTALAEYLEENGYLTDAALEKAIELALATAKDSGEFDGITPTIGENGNWYLGDTDTGKPSRGGTGATPNIQIGTVETLEAGSNATASMGGTPENPLLNLGIPKGTDGKSAYQYAQEGGYTGTEEEFAAKLAEEMPEAYTLPIASADTLGGVQPVAQTENMTQPVGVDATGALFTVPSSGGSGNCWELINTITLAEDSNAVIINQDSNGNAFELSAFAFYIDRVASDLQTASGTMYIGIASSGYIAQMQNQSVSGTRLWAEIEFMNNHMFGFSNGTTASGTSSIAISYTGNQPLSASMIRLYNYYLGARTKIYLYGVRK